jgi:hypothetical protein
MASRVLLELGDAVADDLQDLAREGDYHQRFAAAELLQRLGVPDP